MLSMQTAICKCYACMEVCMKLDGLRRQSNIEAAEKKWSGKVYGILQNRKNMAGAVVMYKIQPTGITNTRYNNRL